jgi:hypothetical protein
MTACFRHRFRTDKVWTDLTLRLQRDDGVIVYIDGREVARGNMPEGPDRYDLYATDQVTGGDYKSVRIMRLPGEPGEHLLTISLHNRHNREGGSSDLRVAEISLRGTAHDPE